MKKALIKIEKSEFDNIKLTTDCINHGNKPFTLRFTDKKVYCPKNTKNATICEMNVRMVWNIPVEMCTSLTDCNWNTDFKVKAMTICHEEDTFSKTKGPLIASAKAENIAYSEAARRLTLMQLQLARMVEACGNGISKMQKFRQHNIDFIWDIIND